MLVRMLVLEGPDEGRSYECKADESANILVGREDLRSEAHWQLTSLDTYVSRNHFIIEIRPPNCRILDPSSKNGTFLKRKNIEKQIEEELIENGDLIRIGKTLLSIELQSDSDKDKSKLSTAPQDEEDTIPVIKSDSKQVESNCIRCGKIISGSMPLPGSALCELDFMCSICKQIEEEKKRKDTVKKKNAHYFCMSERCGQDVSDLADADGRAAELSDVALYYCKDCAEREESEAQQDMRFSQGYVGEYRLIRWLGKGGFGEVYKVWQPKTGRVAAVKIMNPFKTKEQGLFYRFQREISIMQDFTHPNLVRFYEAGQVEQQPYFVSEYVPDGDFSNMLSDEGVPLFSPQEIVAFSADALVGLDYFHRRDYRSGRKYVHRDIKPENILIRIDQGRTVSKLADFGLAKCYEEHGGTITRSKEFAGTFVYMAPEQLTNFKYSMPPVDIYAMGVTVYYLLSGRYPLAFTPMWQVIKGKPIIQKGNPVNMILENKRMPLRDARQDLPRALCSAIDKSISIKPEQRYQSAEDFRIALLNSI